MPTSKTTASNQHDSKFHELFVDELKDIYWAEKNLVKALPKMHKAATSDDLKQCIASHLEETKEHVTRLEKIFDLLGKKAQAKKCEAMEGLLNEGQEVIDETDVDSAVRDAGIIISAQKVEHYEISAYGSLKTLAKVMGHTEIANILESTLEEEKNADVMLTEVAENTVNEAAAAE